MGICLSGGVLEDTFSWLTSEFVHVPLRVDILDYVLFLCPISSTAVSLVPPRYAGHNVLLLFT